MLVGIALQARRLLDELEGGAVGAALAVFAYWLLHGSIDWFWEIPALAAPAFGLLGLAAAPTAQAARAARALGVGRRGVRTSFAAIGAAAAAAALLALWLAASYTDAAVASWRERPRDAYSWLNRAASIDPLSATPLVVEGGIALRRNELERARRSFAEAVERQPDNWYAQLQLGLVAALEGRFEQAESRLRIARALNPQEPVVRHASKLVERREAPDPAQLNSRLIGPTD